MITRRELLVAGAALLLTRKLPAPAEAQTIVKATGMGPSVFQSDVHLGAERFPWLPLDGRVLSRQQYPELHAVLTDKFGSGLVDEFQLPDFRSEVVGAYRPPPVGPSPENIEWIRTQYCIRAGGPDVATVYAGMPRAGAA